MTKERAMEILDPEHREHYDGLEEVNEACIMGMEAIRKQIPVKLITTLKYPISICCPTCKFDFYDKLVCRFSIHCPNCGQALDWDCTEDDG